MQLPRLGVIALCVLALAGCPADGGEVDDITFEPAVDERGTGTIALGEVEVGTNPPPSATIVVTNNTDEEVRVGVDCDDLVGTPFNISCPADPPELVIPPLGSEDPTGAANNFRAVGGTLIAGPNDVGEVLASLFFDYEDRIFVFNLTATITN